MSDESDKTSGEETTEEAAEPDQERPTVAPPFDPIAFAKEILGGGPESANKTPPGTPAVRPPMNTLSDPGELEEARRRSIGTPMPAPRRPTPAGALSLADSNAPSIPAPFRNTQSSDNFSAVDREWEELATSPPPPMQQQLIDEMGEVPSTASPIVETPPEPSPTPPTPTPEPPAPPADDDGPEIETMPSEQEMNDRVSLGDYTGALDIAEKLLLLDPENDDALQCAENCRGVLRQMYTARIGAFDRVPMVMVPRDQLRWLTIDHRAGFVLSLIDGVSSLEMILDVTGMPELDALRILSELVQQRIISFR